MLDEDSFHYVLENTRVVREPARRIDTFGSTSFRFYLVTELMDSVNQVRVRDGRLQADRPQIITPSHIQRELLEGFGEKAHEFLGWLQDNTRDLAILKYGFQFRKLDVKESIVHSSVEEVLGRLNDAVDQSDDPLSVIIQGVDEGWEVSLLKFTSDMIQSSAPENFGDWKRRGLI